jgi:DNA-binding CsgD family transcriptional regulator
MTDQAPHVQLTPRERDVLRLLCVGVTSYADLTEALCMSPNTLNWHLDQLRLKMGVSDRAGIVAFVMVHGLIDPATLEWRGPSAA